MQIYPILCRAGKMDNYSYLLVDEATKTSAVIDPSEAAPIINKCQELGVEVNYILNTHHHFDHTDANLEIKEKFGAKVVANEADKERIPGFDIGITPQSGFELGNQKVQVIDVSAHTQGHILFYFPNAKALFTGDTLFNLCIGGLFEGTPKQMFEALKKIKALPDDTLFYPGHEYTVHGAQAAYQYNNGNQAIQSYLNKAQSNLQKTLPAGPFTLGEEKQCNPYLQAASLGEFESL